MKLQDRLHRLRLERWDLMERIGRLPPRSQARTIAQHELLKLTARVLSTETKLKRKAQNEPAART